MSSPPSNTSNPRPTQPPLFISYVTGSRAGGQWTTRVSREIIDLEPSIGVARASSGDHPEAASRREEGERRRIVLPLPSTTTTTGTTTIIRDVSRSGNTRLGDSVHAKEVVTVTPEEPEMTSPKPSDTHTLRHLWNSGTPGTDRSGELLKGIIVDYLTHERFPNTVGTLLDQARHRGDKGKERDIEDDVIMSTTLQRPHARHETLVKQIEWRKEIREMILSGRISTATDLIRRHFPTLLDTTRDVAHSDDEDDEMEEDDEMSERYQPIPGKRKPSADIPSSANARRFPNVTGFAAGPSGNAARGGAGSRFGAMTAPSNGNGTAATAGSGDVQWTAHPRTGSVSVASTYDAHEPEVPDFPFARTYDRPTLLALNLDIQEFVEGLRILQQQSPTSPSEAVSLSNSLHEETTNGHTDDPMTAPATRKAARDASILACLAHASRLDIAARRLRPREARKYAQQVQDVCGLLAYTDMEASPLAGYLEQGRRLRLAEMVEGCILASIGYPPQSILETLWQQNAYIWHPEIGHLAVNDVKLESEDEGDEGKKMRELAMDLLYDEPLGLS